MKPLLVWRNLFNLRNKEKFKYEMVSLLDFIYTKNMLQIKAEITIYWFELANSVESTAIPDKLMTQLDI
jgi:hypothetical protein